MVERKRRENNYLEWLTKHANKFKKSDVVVVSGVEL